MYRVRYTLEMMGFNSFVLFSAVDVKGIGNSKHVHEGHEQVLKALLDYCITANSQVQVNEI